MSWFKENIITRYHDNMSSQRIVSQPSKALFQFFVPERFTFKYRDDKG